MKKPYKPPVILDIIDKIMTIRAGATVFRPVFSSVQRPSCPARPIFRPRPYHITRPRAHRPRAKMVNKNLYIYRFTPDE